MDAWSKKIIGWDVGNSEDPKLAAALVGKACLRKRAGKRRLQPLILHADKDNALDAGFSKSCGQPPWRCGEKSYGQ